MTFQDALLSFERLFCALQSFILLDAGYFLIFLQPYMKLKITAKTEEIAIMNLHKQQFTGLLVLFTLFVFPLSAQQKLSLDECRRMALEQNR